MHYSSGSHQGAARDRAAIFVDYDNLFSHLHGRTGPRQRPSDIISELLHGVRQHLNQKFRATASLTAAYADFSELRNDGQNIKRILYLQGVEPRFVPASMQRNAAELQLCVDVVESLHTHPDVHVVVIVTGDRPYIPLIQHSLRSGRRPLVIMFRPPDNEQHTGGENVILSATQLLRDVTARELGMQGSPVRAPSYAPPVPERRTRPSEHREITHPGALAALEVIEEHFGQYDEIYLTPLLRKLSEVIGDEEYDPKLLISKIETAGAVWLEKRKGFPYDYTVLLLDEDHPNVAAVQDRMRESWQRHHEDSPKEFNDLVEDEKTEYGEENTQLAYEGEEGYEAEYEAEKREESYGGGVHL